LNYTRVDARHLSEWLRLSHDAQGL